MHPAALPEDRLLAECSIRRTKRSGPGGQHRNKVETAIVITHEPTGVTAEASERRSQVQNRRRAIQRLRVNLAMQIRREPGSEPSELWQSRRRGRQILVSDEHEDFPALLAEALDVLAAADGQLPAAASQLGCSTSQFVKFLKLEPQALELVNRQRTAAGRRRLQ